MAVSGSDSVSVPVSVAAPLSVQRNEFRDSTERVVRKLQQVLRAVVGFHTGASHKIRELQDKFGLNLQTGWQLSRIIHAEDPLDACPHIPGPAAMKKLVATFRRIHPTGDLVATLEEAYDAFVRHVASYADDRTLFDAMTAQLVGGDVESQLELEHCRAVYEAKRFIRGVDCETIVLTQLLHPSLDLPGALDVAHLKMTQKLRRLRSSAPLIVRNWRTGDRDVGGARPVTEPEPLDPVAAERFGIPLLPAFCSLANPPLRSYETALGMAAEWVGEAVGHPGTIDVAFGEVMRHRPLKYPYEVAVRSGFDVAVKLFVWDLLLHRDTFPEVQHATSRWDSPSNLLKPLIEKGERAMESAGYTPLTCREQLTYIGIGAAAAVLAEVPSYGTLLRDVCGRMKWSLEDFAVYRLRVEYPLVHSVYAIRCEMPKA